MTWQRIADVPPPRGRLLVCRNVNGNKYVDAVAYWPDEHSGSGLPELPTFKHATHWMKMPDPPEDGE